jgi:hypothetical protein
MKRTHLFFLFLLFSLWACKNKEDKTSDKSENSIDAARNFIEAALKGDFPKARTYMLSDSVNTNFMDVAERSYQHNDQATKDGYRTAAIRIIDATHKLNDSTNVIIYSNSYKNDPDTLKVVRVNGEWLVDLKYLYLHDVDTTQAKPVFNDSIK